MRITQLLRNALQNIIKYAELYSHFDWFLTLQEDRRDDNVPINNIFLLHKIKQIDSMLTCDYSEQIAGDVKLWKGEQVTQDTQLSVIYFRTDTQ